MLNQLLPCPFNNKGLWPKKETTATPTCEDTRIRALASDSFSSLGDTSHSHVDPAAKDPIPLHSRCVLDEFASTGTKLRVQAKASAPSFGVSTTTGTSRYHKSKGSQQLSRCPREAAEASTGISRTSKSASPPLPRHRRRRPFLREIFRSFRFKDTHGSRHDCDGKQKCGEHQYKGLSAAEAQAGRPDPRRL